MFGQDPRRCDNRRHRFDAFTFTRHQQAHTIIVQGLAPVSMSNYFDKRLDIGVRSCRHAFDISSIRVTHSKRRESPIYQSRSIPNPLKFSVSRTRSLSE